MADGSVVLTEIARGTISRVHADGTIEVVAETGGGPNGAALGPDGSIWVTNNGHAFDFMEVGDFRVPLDGSESHEGGRIEKVDPSTGSVEVVYSECEGRPLCSPNDIVMDAHGGFWFTDHGMRWERTTERGSVFYALCDGSSITEVITPLDSPNGIGLSPDGSRLYVAETHTGRLFSWSVPEPGTASGGGLLPPHGDLVVGLEGIQLFDSLAVAADGSVCVATLVNGGITVASADGSSVEHIATGDTVTTNICFGGENMRTAFITASSTGRLLRCDWPTEGLALEWS
jgi:gluconolactonase